jgi:4-hydroxythreonine-4-phosphate dehydrogenase
MKVLVTQGHEKGIGLEVFFKTCLILPQKKLNDLLLFAFKDSVVETLKSLQLPFEIFQDKILISSVCISVAWEYENSSTQTLQCLQSAINFLKLEKGILYTLPSSKDQFPKGLNGHTEFFRSYFQNDHLGMFFSSERKKVLLITDHIPVSALGTTLTTSLIENRILTSIKELKSWHIEFDRIFISGLNPHCGEDGLIGNEDFRISKAIERLKDKSKLPVNGPFSGDTIYNFSHSPDDLIVYMFHDQGLAPFKATHGLIGSNITLGLPFPRLSPDHGTSFNLFGKNCSDYRGCSFSIKEALKLREKILNG